MSISFIALRTAKETTACIWTAVNLSVMKLLGVSLSEIMKQLGRNELTSQGLVEEQILEADQDLEGVRDDRTVQAQIHLPTISVNSFGI